MKSFYWVLGLAVFLDWIVLPWVWGGDFLIKFALAVLPFAFIFLPRRDFNITFLAVLFYLRSASSYNLGIIFLALLALAVFERWFMINFFHRNVWQTLIISGAGIVLFYGVLAGLAIILTPGGFYLSWPLAASAVATAVFSVGLNLIFSKTYKHVI